MQMPAANLYTIETDEANKKVIKLIEGYRYVFLRTFQGSMGEEITLQGATENIAQGIVTEAYTSESSKNDGERFPVSIMVFSQDWTRQEQIHPTQKPIDLMRYLILTHSNEGDTIFDGYAGSSTIAMACIEENRTCIS